ncbi:MAG: IMS domain-containing protein [Leptolyngbya sp. IPPAS B-1204]
MDDFLRFIQQLRSYLTSAEQQMLFETEARRPSAVATYLAVYALLARGFAQRQPALIRRAKLMLVRLGSHQDVHLEQAVCSLLLGQTEEASRALELSQEFESLAFIRDHSQGSPDLLPGLCLYSERWFQNEVFPHFRDLQQKQAFLTEYFADEDVQAYLEELPTDPAASTPPAAAYPAPSRRELNLSSEAQTIGRDVSPTYASIPSATATMEPGYSTAPSPAATTPAPQTGQTGNQSASRLGRNARERSTPVPQEAIRQPSVNGTRPSARRPARLAANLPANLRLDRILLLAALGLLGLMLLGFLVGKLLNRPQTNTASSSNTVGTNQATPAQTGFSDFVSEQRDTITASAPLDEDNAPEIVKAWLDAKAAAMGENHDIEQLEQILIDPALAQQRARAEDIKAENAHWKFEHSNIEIVSVETDETATSTTDAAEAATTDGTDTANADPTNDADLELDAANNTNEDGQQAAIEALVSEKAEFYTNNQIDTTASYDSTVRVRYSLVRQDGQWRIQEMQVLQ